MSVGAALGSNATLVGLDFEATTLSVEGARKIYAGIGPGKRQSLKAVWMSECCIAGGGAVEVGEALGESQTLEKIDIANNKSIGHDGLRVIMEGIARSVRPSSISRLGETPSEMRPHGPSWTGSRRAAA